MITKSPRYGIPRVYMGFEDIRGDLRDIAKELPKETAYLTEAEYLKTLGDFCQMLSDERWLGGSVMDQIKVAITLAYKAGLAGFGKP